MRDKINVKKILDEVLMEIAKENERVVLVSTDSGKNTGFVNFIKMYPDRFYEFGIMETAGIGVSAGLALGGLIPVFSAPAPFITARPFEFMKIDAGYMHQNIKLIGRNCGFNYADLGPTHHGLEDYALARLVPGMVVLAPTDAGELRKAIRAMIEYEGPVYLRLGSSPIPELFDDKEFEIGKGYVIREGKDVSLICTGEIMQNSMDAVDLLLECGIDPHVIGMPTISPIDKDLIIKAAKKTGRIVTVEEHYEYGGLGTIVSEVCSDNCPVPVKRIAVPHEYISAGSYGELIDYCGLSPEKIAESVKMFLA